MSIANDKFCRPNRRRHKAACLLFVLAIIAQILMPYSQLAANQTTGHGVDSVVVCTSAGLVTYLLNPDGSFQEKPAGPGPSAPCEFCQVCQFGSTGSVDLVAAVPFDFAPARIPSLIANTRTDRQKIQANAGSHPSRAPPGKIDYTG